MRRIGTPDETYESLKPLFGTKGQPPFYDPNDIHTHVWKKGKLGIEDDPKIPTFSKEKMHIKNCIYCKICHKINNKFESSVVTDKLVLTDIIDKPVFDLNNYEIKHNNVLDVDIDIKKIKYVSRIETDKMSYPKLFRSHENNFNEYVKVIDVKNNDE